MGWRTGNFGVINGHVGVLFVGRAADAAISHGENRKRVRKKKTVASVVGGLIKKNSVRSNGHFLWAKKDSGLLPIEQ